MLWAVSLQIKPIPSRVLIQLCSHYNDETNKCYPSLKSLQDSCQLSRQGVVNSIKYLEDQKIIEVVRGGNQSNQYIINTNWSRKLTSQESRLVKEIDQGSQVNRLEVVNEVDQGSQRGRPETVIKQEVKTVTKQVKDSSNHSAQELNNKKYTDQFELFWSHAVREYKKCNSSTGNKSEAFSVWKKLKPSEHDVKSWTRIITDQANTRKTTIDIGGKIAPFKHVCRWLKYAGWEDVVQGWSTGYRKPEEPKSTLRMM